MTELEPRLLLELYLLGELDDGDTQRVEAWLAERPERSAELRAARSLLGQLSSGLAPPPGATAMAGRAFARAQASHCGPRAKKQGWRIAAAVAAVAAVVMLVWALSRSAYPPPKASGSYSVAGGGLVRRGAELRTGAKAAFLSLGGYCRIQADPRSTLQVAGGPRNERILLERGGLLCEVDPGKGQFAVETPLCSVSVRGTKFAIQVIEHKGEKAMLRKQVLVNVIAGVVLLAAGGEPEVLKEGEKRLVPGQPPAAAAQLPEAVRATLQKEAKGATVGAITTVYKLQLLVRKGAREEVVTLEVDAEGRLLNREPDEQLTLDQLPATIKATVLEEAKGRRIEEIRRRVHEARVTYALEAEGQPDVEIEMDLWGDLFQVTSEPKLDELPKAVRQSLAAKAGENAKVTELKRVTRHGKTAYHGEVRLAGKDVGFEVAQDGEILRWEVDDDDPEPNNEPAAPKGGAF